MKRTLGIAKKPVRAIAATAVGVLCSGAGACSAGERQTPEVDAYVEEFATECDLNDSAQECLEDGPDAVRLNREGDLGLISGELLEPGKVRLVVEPDSPLKDRIREGKILTRWRRGRVPLMHRVVSVVWDGDQVDLAVQKVNLRDAFRRGRIRRTFDYDTAASQVGGAPNTAQQPLTLGPSDCSGTIFDGSPPTGGTLSVEITDCSFLFRPEIAVHLEWGTLLPTYFDFEARGSITSDFQVVVQASRELAYGGETKLVGLPDVPVPGFPIVTVGVDVFAGYSMFFSGDAYADVGYDLDAEAAVGFSWGKGSGLDDIFYVDSSFEPRGPIIDFEGSVLGTVFLRPDLRVALVGILGATAGVELYASLDLEADVETVNANMGQVSVTGEACFELGAGADLTLGMDVSLLGIGADLLELTVPGPYFSLLNQCFDYGNVSTSQCTTNDECIVDDDCSPSGSATRACSFRVCSTDCTCATARVPDCCVVDAECDDGDESTLNYCDHGNKCRVRTRCVRDSDCDDGVADTVDTCNRFAMSGTGCTHTVPTCELGLVGCNASTLFPPGSCTSNADCDDGDASTEDTCHAAHCRHDPMSPPICNCDDNDASTIDSCSASGACQHIPAANRPYGGYLG